MQGLLFQMIRTWNDDVPSLDCEKFYCIDGKTSKLHVSEDLVGHNDPVVKLIGPCDGSCRVMIEVNAAVEAIVVSQG